MKRTKLSLTSFVVFAIVGGALAFTGKFNSRICFVARTGQGCSAILQCRTLIPNATISSGTHDCYKIVPLTVTDCSNVIGCNLTGKVTIE
jgi:hypothetical protein